MKIRFTKSIPVEGNNQIPEGAEYKIKNTFELNGETYYEFVLPFDDNPVPMMITKESMDGIAEIIESEEDEKNE